MRGFQIMGVDKIFFDRSEIFCPALNDLWNIFSVFMIIPKFLAAVLKIQNQ